MKYFLILFIFYSVCVVAATPSSQKQQPTTSNIPYQEHPIEQSDEITDIYRMILKHGFAVEPKEKESVHQQAIHNVTLEVIKSIIMEELEQDARQVQVVANSDWIMHIKSEPVKGQRFVKLADDVFELCVFKPSLDKQRAYFGFRERTYQQIKDTLHYISDTSSYKDWRIPTLYLTREQTELF